MKKNISSLLALLSILSVLLLSGCSKNVTNYDLVINFNNATYVGTFSGTIKSKVPEDNQTGRFVSGEKGSGDYFQYDGTWKDGKIYGDGSSIQENCKVTYDSKSFLGTYEGSVFDGIPNGTGKFTANESNDLVFEYSGNWKDGKLSGSGKLKYNKYVVKYSDGTVRTGTFEGNVYNGLPQGEGSYTATNNYDEKYTYTGAFANGKFNGYGKKSFENGKYGIQDGNWKDNEFDPSLVERIQELGTYKDRCEYTLNSKTKKFIKKNEIAFTEHRDADINKLINTNFDLKSFKKNPSSYIPSLVRVSGLEVVQISEYEGYGNKTMTYMLACDSNYDNYYYIYKLDKAKNIVEGSIVEISFIPLGYSTYKTVSNGENWAIVGFAADIKK